MEICRIKVYIQKDSLVLAFMDKMAKWLRRWTVIPLGSAHVGSNPIFTVFLIDSMLKTIAICSLDSAIRIKISVEESILKTSASTFMENLQKTK